MNETIHIVCLDAPAPPDYGGAIDMFYKVKALHEIGKKIILHYFDYHSSRHAHSLKPFCQEVHAYRRKNIWQALPLSQPFTVSSRINEELIARLNQDKFPVLLEGLHCTGIVPFLNNKNRVVIRMHNNEPAYYHQLALAEPSFLKRAYFLQESRLLKRFQQALDKTIQVAALSFTDLEQFEDGYGFQRLSFLPCFLPWQQVSGPDGYGEFCLYHGNLSVSENTEAARWLIDHVFSRVSIPLVIAGKGISKTLVARARHYSHIHFVNNPSSSEIDRLVQEAHINVLPSLNSTGVKLKLLNALLNGRFCLTNGNGIKGSGITKGLYLLKNADEWIKLISGLMETRFSAADREARLDVLALYNNRHNAEKLNALWLHYR